MTADASARCRRLPPEQARTVQLVKGPNIRSLPDFDPLPDRLALPVLLKMGDDVSTDEILPAGAKVLPYRSNIQKISEFAFERIDRGYVERARAADAGHAVVAGRNYGQGSSREHAARRAAKPGAEDRAREEFCAHSPPEPHQLRRSAADFR